jgi:L-fucose isomerase-like protein
VREVHIVMDKIKIGFVPAHREPFDGEWAAAMRKRCLDAFSEIPHMEIVVPDDKLTIGGCVRNDDEAEKTIRLFQEEGIEGLIIGTMTFGDEVSALTVATAFKSLPLMLFGTKEGAFTEDGGRRSDSFCGTLSISSGLYRRRILFSFAGIVFPEEEEFIRIVGEFVRVCSIAVGFAGSNIGLVGPRPERFETCIFSEDELMRQFNQRVVPISLPDIMKVADPRGVNAAAIGEVVEDMRKQADLSELSGGAIEKIAGLEYALAQFAAEKKLSAIGIQCWTAMQEIYGISPCYAMGRLTDRGIMTSCEVDIYGALTMLIQYLAALKATPPHFIDWTIRHQERENTFFAWHCGNAPPSLACEGTRVKISYQSVLGKSLGIERSQGTAEFQLKPGIVTLCRLQESEGDFKMLVTTGEAVQSDQTLRGSWSWIKVKDLNTLYETLVKEGFVHHASLIHGDYAKAIIDACLYLGIEPVTV